MTRSRATSQGAPDAIETVSAVVFKTTGTSLAAETPLTSASLNSIAATELSNALARRVDAEVDAARAAVQAVFPPAIDNPTTGWMELGADSLDLRAIAESVDRIVTSDFDAMKLFEFNTFAMLQNHIAGEKPHEAILSTWRETKSQRHSQAAGIFLFPEVTKLSMSRLMAVPMYL